MSLREGLAFAYGELIAGMDDEQRADVDALLQGLPMPSQLRAEAETRAGREAFAMMGEIG